MDRITRMSVVALRGKRVFMRVDFNVRPLCQASITLSAPVRR